MAWPTKLPYLSGFDQADTVTDQLKDNDKHKYKYQSYKKTWPDHKQKKPMYFAWIELHNHQALVK